MVYLDNNNKNDFNKNVEIIKQQIIDDFYNLYKE